MDVRDEGPGDRSSGPLKRALFGVLAAIGLVGLGGGGYWALTCPCDTTPGVALRGETSEELVTDWTFANDVPLCQIQISIGWRPHALNLNCMSTPDGDLYLSCSAGAQKYWCPRVEADHAGRLRLDGTVYPVVLNRVMDPNTLDAAWASRVAKLQKPEVRVLQPSGASPPADAERPDHWWTFRVQSAPRG